MGLNGDTGTLAIGPNGLGSGPVTFQGTGILQALGNLSLGSSQPIVTSGAGTIDTNGYTITAGGGMTGANDLSVIDSSGTGSGTLNLSGTANPDFQGDLVVQSGFVAANDVQQFGERHRFGPHI